MKVTTKGQVAIPVEIRELLAIQPHDDVTFVVSGDHNLPFANNPR